MDDLLNVCVGHMANENFTEEQARACLKDTLPKLDYWKRYDELSDNGQFEALYRSQGWRDFRVLEPASGQKFNFEVNSKVASNIANKRLHFIPVAFPNGPYTIYTKVTHAWTPVGMLSASANKTITIQGSMYDDYSLGRR